MLYSKQLMGGTPLNAVVYAPAPFSPMDDTQRSQLSAIWSPRANNLWCAASDGSISVSFSAALLSGAVHRLGLGLLRP